MKILSKFPRTIGLLIYSFVWGGFILNSLYPLVIGNYIRSVGLSAQGVIVEKFVKHRTQDHSFKISFKDLTGKNFKGNYDITPEDYNTAKEGQNVPLHFLSKYPRFFVLDSIPFYTQSFYVLIFVGFILPLALLFFVALWEYRELR